MAPHISLLALQALANDSAFPKKPDGSFIYSYLFDDHYRHDSELRSRCKEALSSAAHSRIHAAPTQASLTHPRTRPAIAHPFPPMVTSNLQFGYPDESRAPHSLSSGLSRTASRSILRTSTWILLWPLLFLVARQVPYIAGPARTAAVYQHGAAGGAVADYHSESLYSIGLRGPCNARNRPWGRGRLCEANLLIVAGCLFAFASVFWSD